MAIVKALDTLVIAVFPFAKVSTIDMLFAFVPQI